MISDVAEAEFETAVLDRSREVPVIVDFWAEWCGPCRQLGPAIESAVAGREGKVDLAKVDVDKNQGLAQAFGVRGIPAVKAFRDGKIVSEFTGALPPAKIEEFLDALLPSAADELAADGDEASLRRALDEDPRHSAAARALGRLLVARGDDEEAKALLERFKGDFVADGLLARLQLAAGEGSNGVEESDLERAFAAWDIGSHEPALEGLQSAILATEAEGTKDLLRKAMVAIFTELGPADPLARAHRRRLAAALS